jgi:peptide/nickel transport system substrate-binding protein
MRPRAHRARKTGLWVRNLLVVAVLLGILVSGASALAGMFREQEPPMVAVPDVGGAYVEAAIGTPNYLNPILLQYNQLDKDLSSLLFSGLTRFDERGGIAPDLAERWEIHDDGRVYLFFLKRGVRWHDRTPFTADDVAFTIEAMQHKDFQGSLDVADLWRNVQVEQVDDHTVRFTLEAPFAPFLEYTTVGMLPRHLYAEYLGGDMLGSPHNLRPIGTGPFKLTKISAAGATLEPHADHYGPPPLLGQLQFRFYPDYVTAIAALERDEVDGLPYVDPEDMARLRANGKLVMRSSPYYLRYGVLFLNNLSPVFEDKEVRQAAAHAINKEKLIGTVLHGQGIPAGSPISPLSWAHNPKVKDYQHDPARAEALLEKAGWRDANGDGVREREGVQLSFVILTNDNKRRIRIGELIAEDLRKVGFKAEVQVAGWTDLLKEYLATRTFRAVLAEQWLLTADPDVFSLWHSSQIDNGGFNFSGLDHERMDELLEEARRTADRSARAGMYAEFQELWAEEIPSVILYHPQFNWAVSEKVKDVRTTAFLDGYSRFRHVAEWYVKTKLIPLTPQPAR